MRIASEPAYRPRSSTALLSPFVSKSTSPPSFSCTCGCAQIVYERLANRPERSIANLDHSMHNRNFAIRHLEDDHVPSAERGVAHVQEEDVAAVESRFHAPAAAARRCGLGLGAVRRWRRSLASPEHDHNGTFRLGDHHQAFPDHQRLQRGTAGQRGISRAPNHRPELAGAHRTHDHGEIENLVRQLHAGEM